MSNHVDLSGQTFVVTGSSRGIGAAIAEHFAVSGAAVVINGRDAQAVADAVDRMRLAAAAAGNGNYSVDFVVGSAGDPQVAQELVEVATRLGNTVSALVTCAGVSEPAGSSILTITREQWDEVLNSHIATVFEPCRIFSRYFVEEGHGQIVTTGSFAALGCYGGTAYPAGKGAVTSLTLAIAAELADKGVRANVVCPGARTRLSSGESYVQQIDALHDRGILDDLTYAGSLDPAPPEYVAPLYVYLASRLSAGITGQVFAASGGYIGRFPAQEAELLTYRDFHTSPPFSPTEVDGLVRKGTHSEC